MAAFKSFLVLLVVVAISIGALFVFVMPGVFIDEDVAIRTLETQGFSDVRITGKRIFFVGIGGCGKGDDARFSAVATNPIGKEVEVFVCAGWPFKGATVRTK